MLDERDPVERWLEPYDEVARFIVFVEEFEVAVSLATSGNLAQVRMALVAADHLAEILVTRHAERTFAASEQSWWMQRERFGHQERDRIRGDFGRKVRLAARDGDGPGWIAVKAILDDGDAALFRLAHRERNDVYHKDRHNPAVLIPLTWLYLTAVARSFCRQFRPGSGIGGGLAARVAELVRFGYRLPTEGRDSGVFEFRAAAEAVIAELVRPLRVDLASLGEVLVIDLQVRNSNAAGVAKHLLDYGMPFERLRFAMHWSQLWQRCGADERAQELHDLREQATRELMAETDPVRRSELQAEHDQADSDYIERWHELQRGFNPTATLDTMVDVGRLAPGLTTARSVRTLLERYERLDDQLSAFEDAVAAAARAWDELVDRAVDAALER
jgi:hypothetical protein